tara:strand:+ start:1101 stop:1364 length:264 start_codon:yes stop_codon:yes gene_type:complete
MKMTPQIGDLVHIPQAVELIDCNIEVVDDPQLTIPLRIHVTDVPKVAVVAQVSAGGAYARILYDGALWSVRDDKLYPIKSRNKEWYG